MKNLVYAFGFILSAFIAINISIISILLFKMVSGIGGVIIALILESFGIIMAIAVFGLIRHKIVKSFITDN